MTADELVQSYLRAKHGDDQERLRKGNLTPEEQAGLFIKVCPSLETALSTCRSTRKVMGKKRYEATQFARAEQLIRACMENDA